MTEHGQPVFESLVCLSCEQDASHKAIVSRENGQLIGGLCLECTRTDDWSETDNECSYCDDQAHYNLEPIVPHADREELYTFEATEVHLVCEDHFQKLVAT